MAIAVGTVTSDDVSSVISSHTYAHNSDVDASPVLGVGVGYIDATSASQITGITYDGVAMTFAVRGFEDGQNRHTEVWYLASPSSGSDDVVITYTGTVTGSVSGAITFTGADTSDPLDGTGIGDAESTTISSTVTTSRDNTIVMDAVQMIHDQTITVDVSQDERWNRTPGSSLRGGGSTEQKVTAGATVMSWTISASRRWASASMGIAEAPEVTFVPKVMMF